MKMVWQISVSSPMEFRYGNCIAAPAIVANGKYDFNTIEEAVACIPELQAKNPDDDYHIGPVEKLNCGYGHADGPRRFFPGRLSVEANANNCNVSDWVRHRFGKVATAR